MSCYPKAMPMSGPSGGREKAKTCQSLGYSIQKHEASKHRQTYECLMVTVSESRNASIGIQRQRPYLLSDNMAREPLRCVYIANRERNYQTRNENTTITGRQKSHRLHTSHTDVLLLCSLRLDSQHTKYMR